MAEQRRATLKDVARLAGVSVTTVSVVLNGRRDGVRVPEATRVRVREAAEQLGYRPNQMARNLRQQTSRTLGFLSDEVTTTPFAVSMLAAAQEAAAEHDHLLVVVNLGHAPAPDVQEEAIESLLEHQVSGLVFAAMYHQRFDPVPALPESAVFLNSSATRGPFRSIVPAEEASAELAVRHLLEAGHRRIAFLDDDTGTIASGLRLKGYLAAHAAYDVVPDPRLHVRVAPHVSGGVLGGELLDLPRGERPTGVFTFNDRAAMGLYRAARWRGMSIPGDLSVVGFDDQEFIASELDPPLTTMRLPHVEMGRLAVETVLGADTSSAGWKSGEAPGSQVDEMPCPMVQRESVGPPAD